MQVSRTVGRTYCTKTIIHISQNKRGVAATLAYTYVGLTYVNNVVATIVHRYYFMINMQVKYFTKVQDTTSADATAKINKEQIKIVQQVVGSVLY